MEITLCKLNEKETGVDSSEFYFFLVLNSHTSMLYTNILSFRIQLKYVRYIFYFSFFRVFFFVERIKTNLNEKTRRALVFKVKNLQGNKRPLVFMAVLFGSLDIFDAYVSDFSITRIFQVLCMYIALKRKHNQCHTIYCDE